MDYYGKEEEEAEKRAVQFISFGPGLWRMDKPSWIVWMGPEGAALFDLLFAMYKQRSPGSVPKGIKYDHFERELPSRRK